MQKRENNEIKMEPLHLVWTFLVCFRFFHSAQWCFRRATIIRQPVELIGPKINVN